MGEQPTREERMRRYRQWFNDADTNGNNFLTVEELQDLAFRNGFHPTEKDIRERYMDAMDTNKDGQISFEECCTYLEYCQNEGPDPREELKQAFEYHAGSRKGKIGKETLKQILKEHHRIDSEFVDEVMEDFDTNEDGELDYNEFIEMIMKTTPGEEGQKA